MNNSVETREYGAVFTKRWMVELMLDLCGYTAESDLGARIAVEPSCGDGAFLLPMVSRLSRSLHQHGKSLSDAKDALAAFDLQRSHVDESRRRVVELLTADGWKRQSAERSATHWIREADYLLLDEPRAADFVIGNPPYIRSEDMPQELRKAYIESCSTMSAGTDIYVGFIEKGLRSLKDDAVLSFICADRWMHNAYGRRLRRLVVDRYSVEAVLEMHGVDAFASEVSAYPAVTQVRRCPQSEVAFATARRGFNEAAAERLTSWALSGNASLARDEMFTAAKLPEWFETDEVWPSASPDRLRLLEDLNDRLRPLEDVRTGTRVGIGIASGADSTFITTEDSVAEPDRLLPLVMTRHLRSGHVEWESTWLVNPWNGNGDLVDLAKYPRLRAYFDLHAGELKNRHVAKKAGDQRWYRTIDKVYDGLRDRPKLLLQDMKSTIQPVYDEGHYPHHNLYWITSERWDLHVLGGILLSRVAQMFVEAYGVKMRGGTLRFQAQYLRKIRVPDPDSIPKPLQRRLARAFLERDAEKATVAALEAYGLTELPD